MNLHTYIQNTDKRRELARTLNTSPDWLWQVATGWNAKRASPQLAMRIERATSGQVTRHDLRPDIWPEPGEGEHVA